MTTVPDDPRINTYGQDSGYCANGHDIDAGKCDCDENERDTPQGCTCPISAEHCTC